MKPIVKWQYEKLEGTLGLLEDHLADPDCPCHSDGENCARKHLKRAEDYAQETIILMARDPKSPPEELNKLDQLALEARDHRHAEEKHLCGKKVPEKEFATISWASNWRKYFETLLVSTCHVAVVKDSPARQMIIAIMKDSDPKIKISGSCKPGKTCEFKVKAVETTEGSTSSISELEKVIREVQRRASTTGPAISNRTFAQGTTNVNRYEFDFKIKDATQLVASHDPFTFVPNPQYPQELQPRLRERAATRLQVERIASNIDPDTLLVDYHSIDRGAPITGPDMIVESGNGRIMALMYASKNYPGQFERYVQALKEIAPKYGLDPKTADRMKVPVLIRERVSKVNRKQFVEEANASTTIETSAIEKARTDANKISAEMLQSLEVLEGENIEDALRASRNRHFVQAFLGKLSQNEQARLVDSKGVLNQDGVRRLTMALFVATFPGDVGLRLAEKFFESTDIAVRNVFNGLARSLGPLAVSESMTARGEREQLYTIGDDLAHSIGAFSSIKKTPGMTVAKYLQQSQLFERELTPFQERILVVLDQNSKSGKKNGAILGEYARLVIESPHPAQTSFIETVARPNKAELFETAVNRGSLADVIEAILGSPTLAEKRGNSSKSVKAMIDTLENTGSVFCKSDGSFLEVSKFHDTYSCHVTQEGKVVRHGHCANTIDQVRNILESFCKSNKASLNRRVRFNRADVDSTIGAARKIIEDKPLYISASYFGYVIEKRPPPHPQSYIVVNPDGTTNTFHPLSHVPENNPIIAGVLEN